MSIKARVGAGAVALLLAFVAGYEGDGPTKPTPTGEVVHVAYADPVGIPTICHGTTKNVRLGQVATKDQCKQWLLEDLDDSAAAVDRLVKVDLTDHQKIALYSFIYNVGQGAFAKSTMLKLINQGQFCAAAAQFPRWNKAGGKVLNGLTKRRVAEAGLWTTGYSCPSPS